MSWVVPRQSVVGCKPCAPGSASDRINLFNRVRRSSKPSICSEISIQLPLADAAMELGPLVPFDIHVVADVIGAERLLNIIVLAHTFDRFLQRGRQKSDVPAAQILFLRFVQIGAVRRTWIDFALDTIKARR